MDSGESNVSDGEVSDAPDTSQTTATESELETDRGEDRKERNGPRVEVESVPIPIRNLPNPPSSVDTEDEGKGLARSLASKKLIYHIPSRIAKFLFGFKNTLGLIKDGIISRRYPNRREELVLDEEECDFIDDAFSRPLLKIIKLIGLTSDELFMLVVGLTILLPRGAIAIDEETKRHKESDNILRNVHPALGG